MALQPVSESGAVYAPSGYVRQAASRLLSVRGSDQVAGTLLTDGALRLISDASARSDRGGFLRIEADRVLSPALSSYAGPSFLSLLNLRILSPAMAAYVSERMVRDGATRVISPGYLAFIPAPPAPPEDESAPVVANFNPAPGTPITRTAPIAFDVTDDSGDFRRIFVVAFFPATGATEVVHDGDSFRGHYAAGSGRTMIASGFRYTLLRTGGWPGAPTIQTFAIDRAGNEAS